MSRIVRPPPGLPDPDPDMYPLTIRHNDHTYNFSTTRLSKALGRSAESWLAMQDLYDLWQAKQHTQLDDVQHIKFAVA